MYGNHHEKYDVDETILHRGAAVAAQFAADYLAETAQPIRVERRTMDIKALAQDAAPYVVERRHYYHQHPELTGEEKNTPGLHPSRSGGAQGSTDIRDMVNCYGLIATIHGGKPGKTVGLRADTDALSFQEETGLPFASCEPRKMHACGHDTHIAMLLGAMAPSGAPGGAAGRCAARPPAGGGARHRL